MCMVASVYIGTVGVLGKLYTVKKSLKQICLMGVTVFWDGRVTKRHCLSLYFSSHTCMHMLTHAYTESGEVTHFQAGFSIE